MKTYHDVSSESIAHLEIRPGEEKAGRSGERGPAGWKCLDRSVPPARTRSHKQNILRLLRERGHVGVRGSELYSRPDLYGRSPRNRISELRAEGALIEGKPHGAADWWYRFIGDSDSAKSTEKLEIAQRRAAVVENSSTMESSGLPLFDSAARQ